MHYRSIFSGLLAGLLLLAGAGSALSAPALQPAGVVSLAGTWQFRLDPENKGAAERWFAAGLPDKIHLPGSTDEGGFGTKNIRKPDWNTLSRLVEYCGPAWYRRTFDVPAGWRGKRAELFLERCHWETQVWLDDKPLGMRDSLCVPHVYDLGVLAPGAHTLAIRVDNSLKYNMGHAAHSTSEQTQTNWNGIVGRIELRATDPVWVQDVQVYPDVEAKTARVRVTIGNATGKPAARTVLLQAAPRGGGAPLPLATAPDQQVAAGGATVEVTYKMGGAVKLWDEFSPALYDMKVALKAPGAPAEFTPEATVPFGMRKLAVQEKRLKLNGRSIFLRGTLECCIFPLTGYPPTDTAPWLRIFRIARSYGLNHMRFHSWCPPEAAFDAADQMGFLLHVEAPCWVNNWGKDAPRDQWVSEEVKRILAAYGNHPSFGMLCMGNEPGGDFSVIQGFVKMAQGLDPRHLYTAGSGWGSGPTDDYRVSPSGRGIHGPGTDSDNSATVARNPAPVIEHEVGQWAVFPKMDEIGKYTGVLRARNFELIRDSLKEKGLLGQAADFTRASGKLSALLYKEEIELLLRTPGQGGFALLDLHDFPGQGTALVGMLDPFWDSKGLITPEEWRRFCCPTVPLLRFAKRVYTSGETFTATAEVAHFGPSPIENVSPEWSIKDQQGREVAAGKLPARTLPTGELSPLGAIEAPLAKAAAPAKLTVTLSLPGTEFSNSWEIWVYPEEQAPAAPGDVVVATSWDAAAKDALAAGKKVLLLARPKRSCAVPGRFMPVFWSPVWFAQQRGMMGILCDPKHPALRQFPTEEHTNWQWWELLSGSRSLLLDGTPADLHPIIQVIDDFTGNRKLGYLVEAKVGAGRLVICTLDLRSSLDRRPVARQLLKSILAYMGSAEFAPAVALPAEKLDEMFGPDDSLVQRLGARIFKADSAAPDYGAANAIDGNPDTIWHTQFGDQEPPFPHEIQLDLGKEMGVKGFTYLPRQDMQNGWIRGYEVYVSSDPQNWGAPAAKGQFPRSGDLQRVMLKQPARGRYVRFVALSGYSNGPWASMAEFDLIGE